MTSETHTHDWRLWSVATSNPPFEHWCCSGCPATATSHRGTLIVDGSAIEPTEAQTTPLPPTPNQSGNRGLGT